MKKIAVITLVMIMLVVSAVPAFAKGQGGDGMGRNGMVGGTSSTGSGQSDGVSSCNGCENMDGRSSCNGCENKDGSAYQIGTGVRNPYALSGIISGLNEDTQTITVSVVCGNRLVTPYVGQDVTLQTTDYTHFLLRNPDGNATPISFYDLSLGDYISSHGILADGTFTATRVTASAMLECLP